MKKIYIECEYTLLRKNANSESDKDYTFRRKIKEITVEVHLSYSKGNVIAKVLGATLLDKHVEELLPLGRFDGDKLSKPCKEAINTFSNMALQFTRRILELIKYHLRHDDFQENLFSIKSQKWGFSIDDLHELPSSITVVWSGSSRRPLREDSFQQIEESLNSGIVPLLAMRHLHRAKHENSPHHKWVDATIAAELAIKEVLSRAKPELEVLLLDMPSPPLSKLYGKILKTYLGEESPYKKALIKGVEIRNKLVHRYDTPKIDGQTAVFYVNDVESAIFHLLSLLYKKDSLIKSIYARNTL